MTLCAGKTKFRGYFHLIFDKSDKTVRKHLMNFTKIVWETEQSQTTKTKLDFLQKDIKLRLVYSESTKKKKNQKRWRTGGWSRRDAATVSHPCPLSHQQHGSAHSAAQTWHLKEAQMLEHQNWRSYVTEGKSHDTEGGNKTPQHKLPSERRLHVNLHL